MIASLLKRHEPLLSRPRHCVRQSARQIVIAAALGSLIAAPAGAAEVAQQWSGFHIGANVGYSAGSIATSGNFLTTSGPLVGIGAGSFVPPLTFPGDDRKYSTHGPLGGLQAGYDRQFGKFVAGAEADFQLADLRGSDTFDATVAGPHYSSQTKTNWLVTVRGRLGYAFAGFLPYVTGGLAAARATSSLAIQGGTQSAPQGSAVRSRHCGNVGRLCGRRRH